MTVFCCLSYGYVPVVDVDLVTRRLVYLHSVKVRSHRTLAMLLAFGGIVLPIP